MSRFLYIYIFTLGMEMKALKLIFLVTNFILRCFVVTFVNTVTKFGLHKFSLSSTVRRSLTRTLKLWRRMWKGMYWLTLCQIWGPNTRTFRYHVYMFTTTCFGQIERPSSGSLQIHINKGWPAERPVLYKQCVCCYKSKLVSQNGMIIYSSILK